MYNPPLKLSPRDNTVFEVCTGVIRTRRDTGEIISRNIYEPNTPLFVYDSRYTYTYIPLTTTELVAV